MRLLFFINIIFFLPQFLLSGKSRPDYYNLPYGLKTVYFIADTIRLDTPVYILIHNSFLNVIFSGTLDELKEIASQCGDNDDCWLNSPKFMLYDEDNISRLTDLAITESGVGLNFYYANGYKIRGKQVDIKIPRFAVYEYTGENLFLLALCRADLLNMSLGISHVITPEGDEKVVQKFQFPDSIAYYPVLWPFSKTKHQQFTNNHKKVFKRVMKKNYPDMDTASIIFRAPVYRMDTIPAQPCSQ